MDSGDTILNRVLESEGVSIGIDTLCMRVQMAVTMHNWQTALRGVCSGMLKLFKWRV